MDSHQSAGDVCDGTIFYTNPILQCSDHVLQIIGYFDEVTLTQPLMSRSKKYRIGKSAR